MPLPSPCAVLISLLFFTKETLEEARFIANDGMHSQGFCLAKGFLHRRILDDQRFLLSQKFSLVMNYVLCFEILRLFKSRVLWRVLFNQRFCWLGVLFSQYTHAQAWAFFQGGSVCAVQNASLCSGVNGFGKRLEAWSMAPGWSQKKPSFSSPPSSSSSFSFSSCSSVSPLWCSHKIN